jgi:amino acid permease
MAPGSLRGGIYTLASNAMGPGVLTIPFVYMQMGVCLAFALTVLCGFITIWSLHVLMYCCDKTKIYNYPEITGQLIGPKAKTILDVIIALFPVAQAIGF